MCDNSVNRVNRDSQVERRFGLPVRPVLIIVILKPEETVARAFHVLPCIWPNVVIISIRVLAYELAYVDYVGLRANGLNCWL